MKSPDVSLSVCKENVYFHIHSKRSEPQILDGRESLVEIRATRSIEIGGRVREWKDMKLDPKKNSSPSQKVANREEKMKIIERIHE